MKKWGLFVVGTTRCSFIDVVCSHSYPTYHSAVGIAECIQHPLSKRLVTDARLTIFLEVLLSQPLQSGQVNAAIEHPGCRRYVLIRPGAMAPQLGPHQWWRDEHRQLLSQPVKCPLGLHGFAPLSIDRLPLKVSILTWLNADLLRSTLWTLFFNMSLTSVPAGSS